MLIHLYFTSQCHLCEDAEALLAQVAKQHELQWTCIEISDDSALLNHYGVRIPVLKRLDTLAELEWPFNISDIKKFLSV